MLTKIWIDGFRSLNDFTMEFQPGLNVLIGANGSGKTNIIDFLKFVSLLRIEELSICLKEVGGISSAFTQFFSENNQFKPIKFQIEGFGIAIPSEVGNLSCNIKFTYEAEIDFIQNQLAFIQQKAILNFDYPSSYETNFDALTLEILVNREGIKKSKIHFRNDNNFMFALLTSYNFVGKIFIPSKETTLADFENNIDQHLNRVNAPHNAKIYSIIADQSDFPALNHVLNNCGDEVLDFNTVFNIDPKIARRFNEVGSPNYITETGDNFVAVLYSILNNKHYLSSNVNNHFAEKINNQAKILDMDFVRLETQIDDELRVYKGYAIYKREGKEVKIPFSRLSDGTIKWLTIITALHESGATFVMEEPENCLHPDLLVSLVDILREKYDEYEVGFGIVLLTTHSETMLNHLKPKEIAIVKLVGGKTIVERPNDIKNLNKLIQEQGFGLGYFYVTGALN